MLFPSYLAVFIVVALLAPPALSFSGGAPGKKETCADLTPRHLVGPQTSEPPYLMQISKTELKAAESIEIKVIGKTDEDLLKGFMVQVRPKFSNNLRYVGVFDPSPSQSLARLLECDSEGDTLTHKKIDGKGIHEVSFNWTAPPNAKGSFEILATIVKNGGTYWVADTKQIINVV